MGMLYELVELVMSSTSIKAHQGDQGCLGQEVKVFQAVFQAPSV